MTGKGNKKVTTEDAERKGLMKTPKNAASDTLIRRVRGAGPDGRARTEGKDKSVPVPPRHGSFRGEDAGTPLSATSPQYTDSQKQHNADAEDIPDRVPSFAALAGILNMNRSVLNDIRHRDRRFPIRGPSGWPVFACAHLLRLRDLEKQSDAEHNADARARARETIGEIDAGEWDHLGKDFARRVRDIMDKVIAGQFDYDAKTGRTAREDAIADCLDAIRDAQAA